MKVLIACEESQAVCIAFRKLGHLAFSCDTQPASGGFPQWHIQTDVRNVMYDAGWDLIIAHPPCTHLCISGARWFAEKRLDGRQQEAIDFFMLFTRLPCKKVAIENPVGIMSTIWRKPDQIIQPWMFAHKEKKKTCLWLKGLPVLTPTKKIRKNLSNKIWNMPESKERSRLRSKTFYGIAEAMAKQWGAGTFPQTKLLK